MLNTTSTAVISLIECTPPEITLDGLMVTTRLSTGG